MLIRSIFFFVSHSNRGSDTHVPDEEDASATSSSEPIAAVHGCC